MYLVGLHIYYKMKHGPYNVKLLAILHNTEHSCSRHGVAAARLPIGKARQRYTRFKNIYCVGSSFMASVTVDVFGADSAVQCLLAAYSFNLPNINIVNGTYFGRGS